MQYGLVLLFLISTFSQRNYSIIDNNGWISRVENFENYHYYCPFLMNDSIKHSRPNNMFINRNEDTLFLDDGSIGFWHWGAHYYAQRFTPGVECTLKAIILRTYIDSKSCSLFIWPDSSGYPKVSENLITPLFFISEGPISWQRIDLQDTITISDDFWLAIYTDGSYYLVLSDERRNHSWKRMAFSWSKYIWYFPYPEDAYGEWLFRVICNFSGLRHDVSCDKVYSPKGFLLPNPSNVEIITHFMNFGNTTEKNFPISCEVVDSSYSIVFSDTIIIDSLEHGGLDSVSFYWIASENGNYIVRVQTLLGSDCILDNDTALTETHILTYPAEFYYDDGEQDINAFDSSFVKFTPPYYPCKIESLNLFIGAFGESLSNYWTLGGIYDDDGTGGMPGTVLGKDSILGLIEGSNWYTIDLHTSSIIVDSGSFYAGFFHFTPPSLFLEFLCDQDPPYAEKSFFCNGGNWKKFYYNSEVMARVWVDYPNAVSEKDKRTILSNSLSVKPNVSNGKFKCSFSSYKDGKLEITLYSIDGRRVRKLFSNYVKKGLHHFYPNISDLPQGVYFIRMKGDGFTKSKKFILIE